MFGDGITKITGITKGLSEFRSYFKRNVPASKYEICSLQCSSQWGHYD